MHNHIRLFVAAPLPEILKQQLLAYSHLFRHEGIRFVPEENLHLTLFFIGNTSPEKLPAIQAALAKVAAGTAPFQLKLAAVEPGPNPRHPRLIWARFELHPAFAELSQHLTQLLADNPETPAKPIPHITLARYRKNVDIPLLPASEPKEDTRLEVTEIALWQSELGQPHPAYSIISRFPLTAS